MSKILDAMEDLSWERTFPAGTTILHEGKTSPACYYILDGEVEASIQRDGKNIPLSKTGPNEWIGEISGFLKNIPCTATATATKTTRVCEIRKHDLDELLTTNPIAANTILGSLVATLSSRIIAADAHRAGTKLMEVCQDLATYLIDQNKHIQEAAASQMIDSLTQNND
jgi:CRP-like cAMP-binding protein